jgi:hypothetical protein
MTPEELLEVSAERDRQLALRLNAWRDGYAAAAAQFAEYEARGYARAIADVKAAQHALANHLHRLPAEGESWVVRGQRRTRKTFGHPHPADYPGKRDAA